MVVKTEAYICEKCGHYEVAYGECNDSIRRRVLRHEQIPITGVCKSLDGLIVGGGSVPMGKRYEHRYLVFTRIPRVNQKHEALYVWTNYDGEELKDEHKLMEKLFDRKLGHPGFTAEDIFGDVLDKHDIRAAHELAPSTFSRVAGKLRRKYPKLYGKTEFKRVLTRRVSK